MENPVSINSKRKKTKLINNSLDFMNGHAYPVLVCVACTLLQNDDCGSGSGSVYNDTTITTTTTAEAAAAMAGNNNHRTNVVQTTMESLKISIFTFYIWYRCTATHTTKLNYRGLKTQHFSLHAIFYTYTICTGLVLPSLPLTLLVFLRVSDASHFSKLIRFWLCAGFFPPFSGYL